MTSSANNSSNVTAYNFYTWPVNGQTYTSSGNYFSSAVTSPGCQTFSVLHLTIINSPFNMNLVIDQPISCFGANDGSCQANAFPSSLTYIYQLDGGLQTNNTGFFQNLSAGAHTVCAFNGINSVCKTITFTNPPPLNVTIITDSLVSCLGNDGGLSAIITGGTTVAQDYLTFWTNSANILLNPLPNNFDTFITGLAPGIYHLTVEDDNGCMQSATKQLNAALPLNVTATAAQIQCYGGTTPIVPASTGGIPPVTYSMFGFPLGNSYPAGIYEITATDAKGCTATTLVDFGQPEQLTSTTTTTECGSYYWSINGTTYTSSGTYFALLTTLNGCTVMNMLNLTIGNNTPSSVNVTACNSYFWTLNNTTYTSSGVYTATSLNASGCIHTTTLNLSINLNTSSNQSVTTCNSYTWTSGTGLTYTLSGMYTKTSINAAGCIHTSILNLTINYSTSTSQSITACNTYTWSSGTGLTYTVSGTYTKTSINAAGCVHTSILNLTINYSTSSSQSVSACNAYTWTSGTGLTYTLSGTYTKLRSTQEVAHIPAF
ncbi:serine-rich adhesin for platelets [Filimonas sp.]|nr:serine-rich adhesin for platelets [Filimonas sp.]